MDMLSGDQITAAGLRDWRKLGQGLHARFVVADLREGTRFLTAISEAEASAAGHLEVRLARGRVDLKLIGDDVRDATGRVPILWFQETEPHPVPRQRFHIDIQVPYEVAEQRIADAVSAGATVVDDSRAPHTTVLADPDGNKACVGVFQPAVTSEGTTGGQEH